MGGGEVGRVKGGACDVGGGGVIMNTLPYTSWP